MTKTTGITEDAIRDRDAHARCIARMLAEGVDPSDAILKIHLREFVELDARL